MIVLLDMRGYVLLEDVYGTPIDVQMSNGGDNQKFILINRNDGVSYGLMGVQSRRVIDLNGFNPHPGAPITLWDNVGSSNQCWKFTKVN